MSAVCLHFYQYQLFVYNSKLMSAVCFYILKFMSAACLHFEIDLNYLFTFWNSCQLFVYILKCLDFSGWRSYSDGRCDRFGRRCDARDPGGRRLCHRFVHQTHSNCWPQHYQLHSDTFKRTGNRNSTRTIPGNCQSH